MATPLTELRLLQNINLEPNYQNTFSKKIFPDLATQVAFFQARTVYTFTNLTFQRKEMSIKVDRSFEDIESVTYGMFKNGNTGKWYFFFIKDIRYISERTTELIIEIDVEQTYLFDVTLQDCFVERSHVNSDIVGQNTVPENLDIGNPIINSESSGGAFEDLTFVIATTKDSANNNVQGQVTTSNYSGVAYYCGTSPVVATNAAYVDAFIAALQGFGSVSAILTVFTMPLAFVTTDASNRVIQPLTNVITLSAGKNLSSLDGYVPRNNKLFTYPYNYLKVSNNQGGEAIYRYEDFNSVDCDFTATCDVAPNPTIYLRPQNYNGGFLNEDEMLTLGNYPICTWINDYWQNWKSQNQVSNALQVGGSAIALGAGFAGGNPIAIAGGALGVANVIGNFFQQSITPNKARGPLTGSGAIASGVQDFFFYGYTLKAEYASIIDEYFTKFGYKINRVLTPDITSRLRHNFLKTRETIVTGNIPKSALDQIRNNREAGITFWHVDDIGNYSPVNTISP